MSQPPLPPSSSNPPSMPPPGGNQNQEPTENTSNQKQFHINRQNQGNKDQQAEGKKKKDDSGAVAEDAVKMKDEGVAGKKGDVKVGKMEEMSPGAKAGALKAIAKTIIKMVEGLHAGDNVASMKLKDTGDVPEVFKGANLTIDSAKNAITFEGLKDAGMAKDAFTGDKAQLQALADQLYSIDHNFNGTSVQFNNSMVQLPEPTNKIQSPAEVFQQAGWDREGGGQQGGGGGQQQQGDQQPGE